MNKFKYFICGFVFLILTQPVFSRLYINEIVASNKSILINGENPDWIEIYNDGEDVSLANYSISDDVDNLRKWTFSADVKILANSYLLILANDKASGLSTNFKLSASGETIILSDNNNLIIDKVSFVNLPSDKSFARISDGAEQFVISEPTPNATNRAINIQANKPTFSLEAGFYQSQITLEISSEYPSAKIFYTTDGAIPTTSSELYSSPIEISKTKVVRAIAVVENMQQSVTTSATYFINEHNIELPVISISSAPDNFFGDMNGIYVRGTNGIEGLCSDGRVNWNQDWRRPISMEVFGSDKKIGTQLDAEVRIFGGCSRTNNQKSLCITARDEYGNNRINYKFFADKDIDEFKSVVLRNSGNDWNETMFRDALVAELCKNMMNIDYQAYQPSVVYINGEYFGIHNIREKIGNHYVEENYPDLDKDDIDVLQNENSIIDGDNQEYKALIDFVNNNKLTDNANYQYMCSQIDIDEFIDYMIAEIYVANTDWPQNNIKYWRKRGDGKWRWVLFDTDFGFGIWGKEPSENTLGLAITGNRFLNKLIRNQNFKNQFIQRFAYHISTTFAPERVSRKIDSIKNIIEAEMPYHTQRWHLDMNNWNRYIEHMRSYTQNRPQYMLQFLKEHFKLSEYYNVNIVSNSSNAKINVNGDAISIPYKGVFFADIPLVLTAKTDNSHKVDAWNLSYYDKIDLFLAGSRWKYYDKGVALDKAWKTDLQFDANWNEAIAPLGYGMNGIISIISYGNDYNNKFPTSYFRKIVNIENLDEIKSFVATLAVDDGAVVYVNGKEVIKENMPQGNISYRTYSTTYVGTVAYNRYEIPKSEFVDGQNIIAVEVHQTSATSSDVYFDMSLQPIYEANKNTILRTDNPLTLDLKYDYDIVLNLKKEVPIEIVEIFHAPSATPNLEYLEIYNSSLNDFELGGYQIKGCVNYTFPEKFKIASSSHLLIAADKNNYSDALQWTSGELADEGLLQIVDNFGDLVDEVNYKNSGEWLSADNQAIYLKKYGIDNSLGENWLLANPSPGYLSNQKAISGIVINEIQSSNISTYFDENLKYNDWIELYNSTDSNIDLAGLMLSDDENSYIFPFGYSQQTVIKAHDYLIVWADNEQAKGALHTNFAISKSGETITLSQIIDNQIIVIDRVEVPALSDNYSYALNVFNEYVVFEKPTPNAKNLFVYDDSDVQNLLLDRLNIYPNPTTDWIYISVDENVNYQIENIIGKIELQGRGTAVDLRNLPNGIYILKIENQNRIESFKILKK